MADELEVPYPRPLSGAKLDRLPSGLLPTRQALAGNTVTLEAIDPERHAEGLYAVAQGSAEADTLWDYMGYGPWSSPGPFAAWLKSCAAGHDPLFYAIRRNVDGKLSGMCSFLNIVPVHGSIEIGHIWFAPHLQRTRAATEALFLMLDNAMTKLAYRRMEWKCNALNDRSRAAARRLGFRFEGVFYNHLVVKGSNRDTAWFSILDTEWPEVRTRLQAWLADENFATDGQAKTSLGTSMANLPSPARS
jgi:RimJ/RimL family protein N-acetyltransferase